MKLYPGKCRICSERLMLEIDDDYPADRDPSKLIPMATCNPCFDLRRRLMRMEDAVKLLCHGIMSDTIDKGKATEGLQLLAKKFSTYCSDMLHRQHTADSGELALSLRRDPRNWWKTLRQFEQQADSA